MSRAFTTRRSKGKLDVTPRAPRLPGDPGDRPAVSTARSDRLGGRVQPARGHPREHRRHLLNSVCGPDSGVSPGRPPTAVAYIAPDPFWPVRHRPISPRIGHAVRLIGADGRVHYSGSSNGLGPTAAISGRADCVPWPRSPRPLHRDAGREYRLPGSPRRPDLRARPRRRATTDPVRRLAPRAHQSAGPRHVCSQSGNTRDCRFRSELSSASVGTLSPGPRS
jgi:hypothetical protein